MDRMMCRTCLPPPTYTPRSSLLRWACFKRHLAFTKLMLDDARGLMLRMLASPAAQVTLPENGSLNVPVVKQIQRPGSSSCRAAGLGRQIGGQVVSGGIEITVDQAATLMSCGD